MSRILWDHVEAHYRAQCNSGVILSIDDDAMIKALKNAGNIVFDTEWWVETLQNVLEHWGLRSKRWTDPVTQMPRIHYRLTNERVPTGATSPIGGTGTGPLMNRLNNTGSLSDRLNTGSLSERINGTGPLTNRINGTGPLSSRLNSGKLNSGALDDEDK
ncbi:MAG: hypothetical protein ABIQ44_14725 [Chloroflexia bacterium]